MRIAILFLLFSSSVMAAETVTLPIASQETQNQFIGCLAGYIGAKYMMHPQSDHETTMLLAKQIIKDIAPICPNPAPLAPDKAFTEADSLLNSWMVAIANQFLVSFSHGKKPLPKAQ